QFVGSEEALEHQVAPLPQVPQTTVWHPHGRPKLTGRTPDDVRICRVVRTPSSQPLQPTKERTERRSPERHRTRRQNETRAVTQVPLRHARGKQPVGRPTHPATWDAPSGDRRDLRSWRAAWRA